MKITTTKAEKSPFRIFTLLIVCFIVFTSFSRGYAQVYYQLIDTTKTWSTITVGFGSLGIAMGHTDTHRFNGTFESHGKLWHNIQVSKDSLLNNWSNEAGIREDTLSKKVYLYSDEDLLLYDFGIVEGDTVVIDNYIMGLEDAHLICDSIDQVEIAGQQRNRFHLRGFEMNSVSEIWIEGIGSLSGFLNSGYGAFYLAGGFSKLICCNKNGQLIYQDDVFTDCFYDIFYPKIVQDDFDTAYAGLPYSMQLTLSGMSAVDSIEWRVEEIPEGLEFDENNGILHGIFSNTGNYHCRIIVVNKDLNLYTDVIKGDIPVVSPTGTNEEATNGSFRYYPNPAETFFTIECSAGAASFILSDIRGREVLRRKMQAGMEKIPTDDLEPGIYFIRFSSGGKQLIKKLLVR